ncbi:MAG: hypothetical protein GC161_15570 [Planctomycetaceae bacterium]|nr:hypothetical protein [Planctomycetaceae bacterium]
MNCTLLALIAVLVAPAWGSEPRARSAPRDDGIAPAAGEVVVRRQVAAMGTVLGVELAGPDRRQALLASEVVLRAVERTEARLSTWRADSELTAAQAHTEGRPGRALSPELHAELREALRWSDATERAFDPRIAALVRAFDLRGAGRVPTAREREAALLASGPDAVELRAGALVLHRPGAGIDEGGFGKGAGLDRAIEALEAASRELPSNAPTGARLDFGGQVAFWGSGPRELELAHPRDRARPVLCVTLPNGARSAATSANGAAGAGSAPRHLLDPRTGDAAPDLGSVTAFAPTALGADALSTGFFALGPEASLRAVCALDGEHLSVHALWLLEVEGGLDVLASEALAPFLAPAPGFALTEHTSTDTVPVHARRWSLRASSLPAAAPQSGAPRRVLTPIVHAPQSR